jgi:hypothetical protein
MHAITVQSGLQQRWVGHRTILSGACAWDNPLTRRLAVPSSGCVPPPTWHISDHGHRHEVSTLSGRLASRESSMSTGLILIPPASPRIGSA